MVWKLKQNDIGLLYIETEETTLVISCCYPSNMAGLTLEQAELLISFGIVEDKRTNDSP
jgi:hypothetical protein